MRSNVKDFEYNDQSYIEELVRQVLPSSKINNVVPFAKTLSQKNGDAELSLDKSDNVLYYGYFTGTVLAQLLVETFDYDKVPTGTIYLVSSASIPALPVLFYSAKFNPSASNKFAYFTGWMITLETSAINPVPPTPPPTPPAFEDFVAFYSSDIQRDGGGDNFTVNYSCKTVNRPFKFNLVRRDTNLLVAEGLLIPAVAGQFYRFGAPGIGVQGIRFDFYENDGSFIKSIEYTDAYYLPFDFDVTKPAPNNFVTFKQDSTGTVDGLELVTYFPVIKQGNPHYTASVIASGIVSPLDVVTDSGTSHVTTGKYMGGLLHIGATVGLRWPGEATQYIDVARYVD